MAVPRVLTRSPPVKILFLPKTPLAANFPEQKFPVVKSLAPRFPAPKFRVTKILVAKSPEQKFLTPKFRVVKFQATRFRAATFLAPATDSLAQVFRVANFIVPAARFRAILATQIRAANLAMTRTTMKTLAP